MILMASAVCASVIAVGLSARDRRWPWAVTAACWLPALGAMSARFDPRPEIFSMFLLAAYLAILPRTGQRPALVWLLPILQMLWVNAHALFVLGPLTLGAFLLDRLVRPIRRCAGGRSGDVASAERRLSLHHVGAAAAVIAACLVNPYGLKGALFPLELLPKITDAGGPYKSYVDEFMGLRTFVATLGTEAATRNFYFRAECFLLGILPASFIVPGLWSGLTRSARASEGRWARPWLWSTGLGLAVVLVFVALAGPPRESVPSWLSRLGAAAPAGLAVMGFAAMAILMARQARGRPRSWRDSEGWRKQRGCCGSADICSIHGRRS